MSDNGKGKGMQEQTVGLSPALRAQLRDVGFEVAQHKYDPRPDEWFAGTVLGELGGGDVGPLPSAEAALVGGVRWLRCIHAEMREEAAELHAMIFSAEQQAVDAAEEVEHLRKALAAAQAELRAEREAKR